MLTLNNTKKKPLQKKFTDFGCAILIGYKNKISSQP